MRGGDIVFISLHSFCPHVHTEHWMQAELNNVLSTPSQLAHMDTFTLTSSHTHPHTYLHYTSPLSSTHPFPPSHFPPHPSHLTMHTLLCPLLLLLYIYIAIILINPRRACARVTVLVLSVCLCVCLSVCFPYSGTSRNQAYKQQYQRLQLDTGMKYKKGFFFKTLRSEVMASFTHLE